jgi:hypothetical protein
MTVRIVTIELTITIGFDCRATIAPVMQVDCLLGKM